MKLTDIETFAVKNPSPGIGGTYWVFLKLTTDDGITGYGEVYGVQYGPMVTCRMIEDTFARYLVDESPFDTEMHTRRIYSAGFSGRPDLSIGGILSGLEMACWDIVGKALDQPVYNLLGGKVHERLRSYTYLYPENVDSLYPAEIDASVYEDPDTAAEMAARYVSQGFTAVKFDPVGPYAVIGGYMASVPKMELSATFCQRIREAVGDQADLLFGTHGQMTTASAIRLAGLLEPYLPLWFEEPCPPDGFDSFARVVEATSIPVATGERLTSKYDFKRALDAGVAILQPDLGRSGGILESKKIAALAEAYNAQIAPHLYCGPFAALANIQLATCSPNFLIQESMQTFKGMYAELLSNPIEWQDGYILPPLAPGLGADLNEDVARAHACDDAPGQRLQLEMHQSAEIDLRSSNRNNG
ncbi:MAG: mandelate racemase/muconate lactonizing enzyme family protein [Pseudomonadota bacterium]